MYFVHPSVLRVQRISKVAHTYSGFPVTEQMRLSESPSRKIPEGGRIFTVGATVGRDTQSHTQAGRWMVKVSEENKENSA